MTVDNPNAYEQAVLTFLAQHWRHACLRQMSAFGSEKRKCPCAALTSAFEGQIGHPLADLDFAFGQSGHPGRSEPGTPPLAQKTLGGVFGDT